MGLVWFVVLWIGGGAIGGAIAAVIANVTAAQPGQGFHEGYVNGYTVGHDFGRRYGGLIMLGALGISIAGDRDRATAWSAGCPWARRRRTTPRRSSSRSRPGDS